MLCKLHQETNFFLNKHIQLIRDSAEMAKLLQQMQEQARNPDTCSPAMDKIHSEVRELVNKNIAKELELAKTSELLLKAEDELGRVKQKLSDVERLRKVENEKITLSHRNEVDFLKKDFQQKLKQQEANLDRHFSNLLDQKDIEMKILRREAEAKLSTLEEQLMKEKRINRQSGVKRKAEESPISPPKGHEEETETPPGHLGTDASSTPRQLKRKRVTFAPEVTKGLEDETTRDECKKLFVKTENLILVNLFSWFHVKVLKVKVLKHQKS